MGLDFKAVLNLAAVLCLCSTSSFAANISLSPLDGDPAHAIVVVEGDLASGDQIQFRTQVGRLSKAIVVLSSDGGNLLAGIEIGKIIRLNSFTTVVLDGQRCASACALAWLGGSPSLMGKDARIGFHAAYIEKAGRATETGVGNALVGSYLTWLGLSERAIIYITQAAPSEMTWLTLRDAEQLGIDVVPYKQPPPPVNTFQWVKKKAEEGDARWQEALGLKYLLGDGVQRNTVEALKWLHRSADRGFLPAIDGLGEFYWLGSNGVPLNNTEAIKYLRKAADRGVALAQYRMGNAYAVGRGVPQSYINATAWYLKAARQGHAVAQNNLGVLYSQGLGVQQNQAQAVKWYTCSAEQGDRDAQQNLARKYVEGVGVPQDYILAHKWFSLSAGNEEGKNVPKFAATSIMNKGQWAGDASDISTESRQFRDKLAANMTPAQVAKAQELSRKWQPKENTCVGSD